MSRQGQNFIKDVQYYKFCFYGFFKNLRLFEPFLILFFLENSLTFLQIGILYSTREIVRAILEVPAGIIADSLGRKKTMISSFLFYIISFIIFYLSTTYLGFIAAMVFYSLGDAFRTGTHKAMIFDYLKIKGWENQKVYYYGHTRSYSQLGSAVSALIAGFLVFFTGSFRLIFLFSTIPYVLDLLLIGSYPKKLDGKIARMEKGKISANFRKVFLDFLYSFKEPKIIKAIANLSVFTGYYRAMKDYLQPVLKTFALALPIFLLFEDKQRSSVIIGITYFLIYLLTSYSSRNSGKFTEIFNNLNIPMNLTILLGISIGIISGLMYELDLFLLSILLYIGIYIVENVRKPIGISKVAESIDKNILASVLSAESQAHTIIAAIIAPAFGYLADLFGLGYGIAIISGGLLVLSPLYLLRNRK